MVLVPKDACTITEKERREKGGERIFIERGTLTTILKITGI